MLLQWSPVLETGNTFSLTSAPGEGGEAAMEPGLRDREYDRGQPQPARGPAGLQWSPVLETGNTT